MRKKLSAFTILLISFLVISFYSHAQDTEILTNQSIIELTKSNVGKEVIKNLIEGSPCKFEVGAKDIISLGKNGVDGEVINFMMAKMKKEKKVEKNNEMNDSIASVNPVITAAWKLGFGVYYKDSNDKLTPIDASIFSGIHNSTNGLLYGGLLSKQKKVMTIGGKVANLEVVERRPAFIFFFDKKIVGLSGQLPSWASSATNPGQFTLAKFDVTKSSREVIVGSSSFSNASVGINDNQKISFKFIKIADGMYSVVPNDDLTKGGQYAFMFSSSLAANAEANPFIYEFGIKK
jgi:hypothetical protein